MVSKDDILQQVRQQQQRQQQQQQQQQGNRRSHFPALCTPVTPGGDGMIPSAARRYLQRTRYSALSVWITFYSRYNNSRNNNNKAIVDLTSPPVCTPITPWRRQNDPFCCVTLFAAGALQCVVSEEENPQNWLLPFGFRHPAGGGPSHGHRQHAPKNW